MGKRRMTLKDAKRIADRLLDSYPRVRVFRAKGLGVGNIVLDLHSRRSAANPTFGDAHAQQAAAVRLDERP